MSQIHQDHSQKASKEKRGESGLTRDKTLVLFTLFEGLHYWLQMFFYLFVFPKLLLFYCLFLVVATSDTPLNIQQACICHFIRSLNCSWIIMTTTFVPPQLPLVVLRAILLEVVVHDGDVAIRTLALTCSCFNNIVCMESFRREAHFRWLDSRFCLITLPIFLDIIVR